MTSIVTRAEWGAKASSGPMNVFGAIIDGVALHYEGPHMGVFDHDECAAKIRGIQDFHMNTRGWSDIAYNFIVCPHGIIYEGRGTAHGSAANGTTESNAKYMAICGLWGQNDAFTELGRRAMKAAIGYCQAHRAGTRVRPHSDFFQTSCPGDPIRQWIAAGCPADKTPIIPPKPAPAPTPKPHPVSGQIAVDGAFGSATVHKLQEELNKTGANPKLSVDGDFGPASKKALQARLNHTNGPVGIDGVIGGETIRALQKHVGASVDGAWGKETTTKLQEKLNAGKF